MTTIARSFRFHNVKISVLLGKLQPFGHSFQVRIVHFCNWWHGIYVAHILLPSCGCPWMVERSTICFPRQVAFLVLVVMLLGFSPGWDVPMANGPANCGFTTDEGKRASLFRRAWRLHTFVFSCLCGCVVSDPSYLKCPKFLSDLFAYPLSPLTYSFLFYSVPICVSSDRLINRHFETMSRQIYNFSQNEYRG